MVPISSRQSGDAWDGMRAKARNHGFCEMQDFRPAPQAAPDFAINRRCSPRLLRLRRLAYFLYEVCQHQQLAIWHPRVAKQPCIEQMVRNLEAQREIAPPYQVRRPSQKGLPVRLGHDLRDTIRAGCGRDAPNGSSAWALVVARTPAFFNQHVDYLEKGANARLTVAGEPARELSHGH
jgi:hypothetical protein